MAWEVRCADRVGIMRELVEVFLEMVVVTVVHVFGTMVVLGDSHIKTSVLEKWLRVFLVISLMEALVEVGHLEVRPQGEGVAILVVD